MLDQVAAIWPNFSAIEWYRDDKGLTIATVELDRETEDFSHLINQEVLIDRLLYKCLGVSKYTHCPPWSRGEVVGLLVEPAK